MKDWRIDYIICEHICENEKIQARHSGFRVCCENCYEKGFLFESLDITKSYGLTIGKIKENQVNKKRNK